MRRRPCGYTTVTQPTTHRPAQFEITEQTRESINAWIRTHGLRASAYLFASPCQSSAHLSTRQYARLLHRWIASIGLDDSAYGTHTLRDRSHAVLSEWTEMRKRVLTHQHIHTVHLCRIGQDGVHPLAVAENVSATAVHMCLAPRQIGKCFENGEAGL